MPSSTILSKRTFNARIAGVFEAAQEKFPEGSSSTAIREHLNGLFYSTFKEREESSPPVHSWYPARDLEPRIAKHITHAKNRAEGKAIAIPLSKDEAPDGCLDRRFIKILAETLTPEAPIIVTAR